MPSPSNIYAEKIFSEQPISIWSLDDKLDYISLLPDNSLDDWSISGGTAVASTMSDAPFSDSSINKITTTEESATGQISCISQNLLSFSEMNRELGNFSVSSYVYSASPYIDSYEIGYEYFDELSGQTVQNLKLFNTSIVDRWIFISETFDLPEIDYDFRVVLKINYFLENDQIFDDNDFIFYVNGVAVGQWSEEFSSTSLGVSPISIPGNIHLVGGLQGIEAREYGFSENSGYYLVKDNSLRVKNSGMPLVYGAKNNTNILSNGDLPSLIVPGYGFLNNSGKYQSYTLEFWMRIENESSVYQKIVGPIGSADGLYVNGPFLTLSIGKFSESYYVGEWFRPMLIDIRYSPSNVSVLLNGDQVISFLIDPNDISFPENSINEKNMDWIGFYAPDGVYPFEIDCIALYSYQVSNILAKRRWIYGQAVEVPENINAAYSGTSFFIDYPFSKYSNNYNYPDISKWQNGILENINVLNNRLSPIQYDLPQIIFQNKTMGEWEEAIFDQQNEFDTFISLKPSVSGWENENPYIYFPKFNVLSESVKAFYGIFKTKPLLSGNHPLIKIKNSESGNSFNIEIADSNIIYYIVDSGIRRNLYTRPRPDDGEVFVAGFDIDKLSDFFGPRVSAFFGTPDRLNLYVGGEPGEDSFTGNIYKISFLTERNLSKVSSLFGETGIAGDYSELESYIQSIGPDLTIYDLIDAGLLSNTRWSFLEKIYDGGTLSQQFLSEFSNHMPSYSFFLNKTTTSFKLDIASESYWEDYIPLSYFAKNVTNSFGDPVYTIDFLQFNVDYPAPSSFIEDRTDTGWTYEDLQAEFANPTQRGYSYLDNELFTGYSNYIDLRNKTTKTYKYDTSSSLVKTYISFQYLASGSNESYQNFTNVELTPKNGIVEVGKNGEDWLKTKYEVVDNTIIYPPQNIDFNSLAIVVHLEIACDGIRSKPIKIRSLQLASQSLSATQPTPIGTRFGNDIYPYKKSGIYFDYKSKNPFTIYKESTPYLYLTKKSGIEIRGDFDPFQSRGMSLPINQTLASSYSIIAMQASLYFAQDFFPFEPIEIFEIQSKTAHLKFYLKNIHPSGKRAKIYAINAKTGKIENGIAFYINGNIVKDPVLTIKEWTMLGINFANSLNFNNYSGAIRVTGPILFNNVSHYQATNLQEVQQVSVRPWFKVKGAGSLELDWQYWEANFLWNGVLVISSTSYYGVNPSDIYKMYTGTNKIIVDDSYELRFSDYQYSVYSDIVWQSKITTAV